LKRHIENGGDASGGGGQGSAPEILTPPIPRIVEVNVHVNAPRKDQLAPGVFHPARRPDDIPSRYRRDFSLRGVDIALEKPIRSDNRSIFYSQIENSGAPPLA
jgi:hypothetical protein